MSGEHVVFDIAAWLGALGTTWLLYRWRFAATVGVFATTLGPGYFLALSGGGLLGAYGFGTWNAWLSGQAGIGRSILGGLTGAILLVELYKHRRGIRGSTGVIFALPLAIAVAIGRLGCFRAGLDDFTYGTPTFVPWGVDFGDGIARHPVQLYESLTMALTAATLLPFFARRSAWVMTNGFYLVVGTYAAQRFAWEFLKPYGTVIGPFNLFHILCSILAVYAVCMVARGSAETT